MEREKPMTMELAQTRFLPLCLLKLVYVPALGKMNCVVLCYSNFKASCPFMSLHVGY